MARAIRRNAIRANRFARIIRNWNPYFYSANRPIRTNHSNFRFARITRYSRESCESIRANHATLGGGWRHHPRKFRGGYGLSGFLSCTIWEKLLTSHSSCLTLTSTDPKGPPAILKALWDSELLRRSVFTTPPPQSYYTRTLLGEEICFEFPGKTMSAQEGRHSKSLCHSQFTVGPTIIT